MGLNPRGRGRGIKGRRGGGMAGPGPMFRGPPGMYGPPPMGFPPGPPPFGPPFFGGPGGSNFGPRRPPGYGKFPRKNFKGRNQQRNSNSQAVEIDLSKPWVTEEIKSEESKKLECLETWRKSKDDNDWSKYKEQKQVVQEMYDKAKAEYLANKPEEDNKVKENIAEGDNKNGST
ncbi:UNVERIFIED_CONTAM: hypothetical protein PYX00_006860 [Menopon gallinae]|uniref:Uncharacterized protein n=1 Tax=Menopon gallinae TaxID=328185 RepID=A0AAW2HWP1_9NEOP